MKIVCTADAHVHPRRLCSRDGGHDRLLDGLRAVRQGLELARQEQATWVFAGDMKDPKTVWPQQALTGLHALFRQYKDVEMVMVAGNHDAMGEGGSGLAPFRDVATVVDDGAQVVTTEQGAELVCSPWNADPAEAADLLARVDHPKVLIAHGFIAGCLLGPEDARIAKGTPIDAFGEFDVAVFGDVHKAQVRYPAAPPRPARWEAMPAGPLTLGRGYVLYCGDPYQQNWGERNDGEKGALLVDLLAQTAALHPTVEVPQYLQLELDEAGLADFVDHLQPGDGSDFVRVVYSGRAHDDLAALREWGEKSCRSFQLIVRRPAEATSRAQVHAGMSRRELLAEYMKARPPKGDAPKTLEAGIRLGEDRE